MVRRLIRLAVSLAVYAGDTMAGAVRRLLGKPAAGTGVLIYYHEIMDADRQRFAAQLDVLLCQARPINALIPTAFQAGQRYVAVTVDDAFVSFFQNGLPELERRKIPVAIFVPTAFVGRKLDWAMEEEMESPDQQVASVVELQALALNPLIRFGSHTVNHRNLTLLSAADVRSELVDSKKLLEQILRGDINSVSFPYGAFTERELLLAQQAGYKTCFTTSPSLVAGELNGGIVGRVRVEPSDWMLEFKLKLAGAYRWQERVQRLRSRRRERQAGPAQPVPASGFKPAEPKSFS
jgi:peptidoglycan/xylan/chitin deacetylase (PgdA/CDA1 family)